MLAGLAGDLEGRVADYAGVLVGEELRRACEAGEATYKHIWCIVNDSGAFVHRGVHWYIDNAWQCIAVLTVH